MVRKRNGSEFQNEVVTTPNGHETKRQQMIKNKMRTNGNETLMNRVMYTKKEIRGHALFNCA